MSVIYKDRDDTRGYTTVRRYRIPDRNLEEEDTYEKQIVIKRDRDAAPRYERDREFEYRTREREAPREVIRYEREVERAPSPPEPRVREYRFEREVEREPARRDLWDLEKYTRSTDYYPPPQPIIIRQEAQPIIIKESPRYEFLERDEVREDRQLVRREEPPPARRRDDEDYYYERTTREVDRGPRRGGGGGEEVYDERDYRVNPRESASQYADDRYSSDDEVIVTRKERTDGGSRSPHRRRHLAEGAVAGLGAAELLRHHRRKQGEDGGHRGRQLIGGAALGAVGAEAISRARSHYRGSRSRSRSSSRSYRSSRRRRHHRSRSRSQSRVRTLAKVGTVAAVGALAAYALRNRGNNKETVVVAEPPRRSRSRRRRSSVSTGPPPLDERADRARSESRHQDPEHRNRRIAQAGLASAAAAGILDHVRSRSRRGKSRSKSRIRTGVPIAAAGLGGAAVAGLYERNKARQEAPRDGDSFDRRSRSRSRSVSYPDDGPRRRRSSSDPAMIEYGDDPIYPTRGFEERPAEYRRRRRGSSASSSPDRRGHSRSRSRSRSRTRGLAEAAAAAGVAGVAAHEMGKRSERRRERERRRHEEEEPYHDQPYSPPPMGPNATYPPTPQGQDFYPSTNSFPPPPTEDYARQAEYPPREYAPYNPADYPPPPPPAAQGNRGLDDRYSTPDDTLGYPPPNETYAGDTRYNANHRGRPDPEHVSSTFAASGGAFGVPEDFASDGVNQRKSVQFNVPPSEGMSSPTDERKPKSRSTASEPDMDQPPAEVTEDRTRLRSDLSSDGIPETEHKRRRRRRRHRHHDGYDSDHNEYNDNRQHQRRRRRRSHDPPSSRSGSRRATSVDSELSDQTVELPPRFDQSGRKVPERGEDPMADKIEDMLSGKGFAGGLFKRLTGDILGDGTGAKKRR